MCVTLPFLSHMSCRSVCINLTLSWSLSKKMCAVFLKHQVTLFVLKQIFIPLLCILCGNNYFFFSFMFDRLGKKATECSLPRAACVSDWTSFYFLVNFLWFEIIPCHRKKGNHRITEVIKCGLIRSVKRLVQQPHTTQFDPKHLT